MKQLSSYLFFVRDHLRDLGSLVAVAAIFFVFSPFQDTWWPKWAIFYVVAAVMLGYYFGKRYHWSLGCLTFSVLFSGSFGFANRMIYALQDIITQVNLAHVSSRATLAFFLFLFIGHSMKSANAEKFLSAYLFICAAHCLVVLHDFFINNTFWPFTVGFLPNVSVGPCMLSILLPLALWRGSVTKSVASRVFHFVTSILFVIVICKQQSSMGYATLVAGTVTLGFCLISFMAGWKKAVLSGAAAIIIAWQLGGFVDPQWRSWTTIDRFEMWADAMTWWKINASWVFGTGTGTFRHFGSIVQGIYHFQDDGKNWWTWLHSDALQLIFETGLLGLFSAIVFLGVCLYRAFKALRFEIVASIVAYIVMALGNYPLRLAEFATLGMVLLTISIKLEESENGVRTT